MTPDPEALLAPLRRLTAREREVLHLDCQGHTAAEIAEALRIGERTVYGHLQRIYAKLGLVEERDNLRQRKLVFFCLALPHLDPAKDAGDGEPPSPPEAPPSAAEEASFERDRTAIVRWRRGELRGPDAAAPPGDPGEPRPPARLVVVGPGAAGPAPRRRPSWRLLVVVAVLAALVGGAVTAAALSRSAHSTPLVAPSSSSAATGSAPQPTLTPILSGTAVPSATAAVALAPPSPVSTVVAVPPRPTPAPTVPVAIGPAATPLDLAGKVASKRPGTPLRLGEPVASIIDQQAKPYDVYALQLRAGQTLHVEVTASSTAFGVTIAAAGAQDLLGEPGIPLGAFLCNFTNPCRKDFAIAADGTYTLVVGTNEGAGIRYTLGATAR